MQYQRSNDYYLFKRSKWLEKHIVAYMQNQLFQLDFVLILSQCW